VKKGNVSEHVSLFFCVVSVFCFDEWFNPVPVFLNEAFGHFGGVEFREGNVEFGGKFFFEGCRVLDGFQVLEFVGNVGSYLVKVDGIGVKETHEFGFSVLAEAFVEAGIF
jgi:hypothetical protein